MPIWGGDQVLGKARAIENRIFLVASGYDYPTYVMDPEGEILSRASKEAKPRSPPSISTSDTRILTRRHAQTVVPKSCA